VASVAGLHGLLSTGSSNSLAQRVTSLSWRRRSRSTLRHP